jgi:hypothetical protein
MYDLITNKLWEILLANTTEEEANWLSDKSSLPSLDIMTAFVAVPRFLKKKKIALSDGLEKELSVVYKSFSVRDWSLHRLARVWLLTKLVAADRSNFVQHIETLFDTAEINEFVALHSALPILPEPKQWLFRATDAVRSNMGLIFDAIALNNPYPATYFTELAWNQLVLKTIFNDKPIHLIHGLEERANEKLAWTLSDFAHERWAAGRQVAPQVWRLVVNFVNDQLLADIQQLFKSPDVHNQQAAALVCAGSNFAPAQELLTQFPELQKEIQEKSLTWANLEFTDLNTYVS